MTATTRFSERVYSTQIRALYLGLLEQAEFFISELYCVVINSAGKVLILY